MSTEQSYFDRRMAEIGAQPDHLKLLLKWGNEHESKVRHVVYEDEEGNICFLVYDLDGFVITHQTGDPAKVDHKSRVKDLVVKRLKVPKLIKQKDGTEKEQKYDVPKGAQFKPFIPPGLMKKFHAGEDIETLILTEGYIKALCGDIHGFDIIGLPSITGYKDKGTQTLHPDILQIISERKTKNVVILYDGDAQRISTKALEQGKDIYQRPASFFASARSIRELLKDHLGAFECDLYFAQVKSDSVKGEPKGFDDLILAFKNEFAKPLDGLPAGVSAQQEASQHDAIDVLRKDLFQWSRPGIYFEKYNITHSMSKVQQWLHISSVQDFYTYHQERLKENEFIYLGTRYKYDAKKGECEVIIPGAARDYFRCGTRFYRHVEKPNKYGVLEKSFDPWEKQTIKDDYGANFLNHIPKYVGFVNVPQHDNYQSIIHNCFNVYFPFEHQPEEGECTKTLAFIRHIFGEQYELGLDYLQLLYQRPTQILPILCLVSKQNNTGKSTFAKWLNAVFTQNMVIVGNAELQNDFNASWATRLLICCEESFIDKKIVVEKIKALATADKILMNAKGKDHVQINFFGKFLFLSNNEENFIYAGEEDIRYWVRKIPVPTEDNTKLLEFMIDEIPQFLHFLSRRSMSTEDKSRMWFHPKDLETEALKKVRMASKPTIEKELRMKLREYFLEFGEEVLMMTLPAINQEWFRNKYELNFLRRILMENLKVDQYHKLEHEGQRYEPQNLPQGISPAQCRKQYMTFRSHYFKREYQLNGSEQTREFVKLEVKENGKPFVFHRHHFVSDNDLALHVLEQEAEVAASSEKNVEETSTATEEGKRVMMKMRKAGEIEFQPPPPPKDDLPF